MDGLYYYSLRFTPYPQTQQHDSFCMSAFETLFDDEMTYNFIGGRETARNIHYHIVFSCGEVLDKSEFRDKLYAVMKVPDDKKGNTSYSLEDVRDLETAVSYATKDGDYFSTPDWASFADECYKKSHKKKQSSKGLMEDLYLRFEKGELNERSLWIELFQGRSALFIPTSYKWLDEVVTAFKVKKNPKLAIEIWEQRESKKNLN